MTEKEQTHIFAMNLKRLISKKGKLQKEIAKELGVSPTTLNNWCREVSMPKAGVIQNIADYFDVVKTELLDNSVELGESDALILKKIQKLNPQNREIIIATINTMLDLQG